MSVYSYYCPGCEKKGEICVACFFHEKSLLRLDLAYVICCKCRLVYYDKRSVLRTLSEWRRLQTYPDHVPPFWETYRRVIILLNGIMEQRKQYGGYAYRRFTTNDHDRP